MTRKDRRFEIAAQPNNTTCGPTCLQAVYRFFRDDISLERVIDEVHAIDGGGTLAPLLANHALARGYRAVLYTINLRLFDPTWFALPRSALRARLAARVAARPLDARASTAGQAYLEFLDLGGELRFTDLSTRLLVQLFERELPVLTGLSATWLYRDSRELPDGSEDDIGGDPVGHFVALCGYDDRARRVQVADPLEHSTLAKKGHFHEVAVDRLINAILLGVLTYDGNLLQIEPSGRGPGRKMGSS